MFVFNRNYPLSDISCFILKIPPCGPTHLVPTHLQLILFLLILILTLFSLALFPVNLLLFVLVSKTYHLRLKSWDNNLNWGKTWMYKLWKCCSMFIYNKLSYSSVLNLIWAQVQVSSVCDDRNRKIMNTENQLMSLTNHNPDINWRHYWLFLFLC